MNSSFPFAKPQNIVDEFQREGFVAKKLRQKSKFICYDSSKFLVGIHCDRNDISMETFPASLFNYIKQWYNPQ